MVRLMRYAGRPKTASRGSHGGRKLVAAITSRLVWLSCGVIVERVFGIKE